jgi:hypothetical protein
MFLNYILIIHSKQYHIQGDYIKNILSRAWNENQLFEAPIVALPNPVSHLTYDEMVAREFQPKQQKKDQWTSAEVAALLEAINDISSDN